MNEPTHDPVPDPHLGQALDALDRVPVDDVDWTTLRSSIAARAELPLARRRRAQRDSSRWRRPLMPAVAAAALAGVLATQLIPLGSGAGEITNGDVPTAFHPAVEQVLGTEISEFELDLLFGQVNADVLVVAALDRP